MAIKSPASVKFRLAFKVIKEHHHACSLLPCPFDLHEGVRAEAFPVTAVVYRYKRREPFTIPNPSRPRERTDLPRTRIPPHPRPLVLARVEEAMMDRYRVTMAIEAERKKCLMAGAQAAVRSAKLAKQPPIKWSGLGAKRARCDAANRVGRDEKLRDKWASTSREVIIKAGLSTLEHDDAAGFARLLTRLKK